MNSLGTKYLESKVKGEMEGIQEEMKNWADQLREFFSKLCQSIGFGNKGDNQDNESSLGSPSSSFVSSSRGGREPISDVLERHDLPGGIFPSNYRTYKLTTKGNGQLLEVRMPFPLEVEFPDGTKLRFNKKVTCFLSNEELLDIEGIKYLGSTWSQVRSINVESRVKLAFHTRVRKAKKLAHFQEPVAGIRINRF